MTNALGLKVENAYTTKNELLTVHAFGLKQAEFAYDDAGQMTRITDALGNVKQYEYLGGGRLRSITDGIGTVMQFTYDGGGNVLSTTNGAGETATFTYDADGNALSKTLTRMGENGVNKTLTETYQYDVYGNRTQKAAGDRTTTYVYDGFNRLVRATVQEGANVAVEEYGYDWKGNRIRKSREGNVVRYLVDTNNWISHVVAETDGSGTLRAFYTRGGDGLIAMDRGGTKSWYLYDGHGSVRMLANGTGQTTDTWTYDAWGETTSRTGVTENDYLYAGERFDQTTELYQLRARYLDPKTGTFLSLDPYQGNRHDPASLHKYMYANANPVNNTDPTGLWTLGELGGAMAGQGILAGANGLNFAAMLGLMIKTVSAIELTYSITNLVTSALAGDIEGILHSIANGALPLMGLVGACESCFAVRILTKALAAYGANESTKAFLKAVREDNVSEMLSSGLHMALDLALLFWSDSCFDGDTPVATETGSRRIDEIRAGDRVWSYNVETGERALKEVKEVLVRENDKLLHIETSRGAVDATTSHPFYVVGKGWVAAGDLAVGDGIQAISGDAGVVTGLKLEKLDKPIPVYNLDVEDFHSYFVADGVLVHNVCVAKEGNIRADVHKGGEPNHFRGHAHIREAGKKVASIDELGEVVVGKLSKKAKKFVDKYSQQIQDGIKEWYYAR